MVLRARSDETARHRRSSLRAGAKLPGEERGCAYVEAHFGPWCWRYGVWPRAARGSERTLKLVRGMHNYG